MNRRCGEDGGESEGGVTFMGCGVGKGGCLVLTGSCRFAGEEVGVEVSGGDGGRRGGVRGVLLVCVNAIKE